MHIDEIKKMHQLETIHWWFQGKLEIIKSVSTDIIHADGKYLDIGCGTGMFLKEIGRNNFACGLDISAQALSYCKTHKTPFLIRGSIENLPFSDNSFSNITLLDILEHTKDDLLALKEVYRVCKPGGFAIITVPAFHFLWGNHDIIHDHKRRYTKQKLKKLGLSTDFTIKRLTYTNFLIFLPVLLRRTIFKNISNKQNSDLKETTWSINKFLQWTYKLEAVFLKKSDLPWGVSLLMILKKIDSNRVL